jgi:hypothetical protein
MSLKSLASQPLLDRQSFVRRNATPDFSSGHAHFWERAALSRRSFLKAAGTTLAVGLALPSTVRASSQTLPNPIPGGLDLLGNGQIFHFYLPGTAPELSTITDFNGVLGAADVQGTWTGDGVTPPPNTPLLFDADMRFMSGEYIGRDGRHRQGAFALV